jgi:hypothetical protein
VKIKNKMKIDNSWINDFRTLIIKRREYLSKLHNTSIDVLVKVKKNERYVFLYDDASRAETLRVLGRFALNDELSFNWYDVAILSQKIRQESQKIDSGLTKRFDIPLPDEDYD